MQNARPAPSSCLPASGERPFNRTCVTGVKKERDKASQQTDSISFFVCFFFTTRSASTFSSRSPSVFLFSFPYRLCSRCVYGRSFWALSAEHLLVFPSWGTGRKRSYGGGVSIVLHREATSNEQTHVLVVYKTLFSFFPAVKAAEQCKNNRRKPAVCSSHTPPPHKLVYAACKQQTLLLFLCVEDALIVCQWG